MQIEQGHYFYGAVLPLVAGVRAGKKLFGGKSAPESDMRAYGSAVNAMLYGVCRAEVGMMKLNRLGGTSVMVRAVKP